MNFVITGRRNVGKTTVVKRVVQEFKRRNIDCGGFYTIYSSPSSLSIVSVRTGEQRLLASVEDKFSSDISTRKFNFNPDAILFGLKLITSEKGFLVADELGKLEKRGEGFFPIFDLINKNKYPGFLLSVRKGLVEFFQNQLAEELEVERLEVKESNRDSLPNYIASRVQGL